MAKIGWRNWGDHPIVTLITVLASLAAIAGFVRSCATDQTMVSQLEPCVDVIGRWDWLTTGGIVSIAEGGGLTWHQTADAPVPSVIGNWSCDGNSGEIELRWNNQFTEVLSLSDDGNRLSGRNNQDVMISATRVR